MEILPATPENIQKALQCLQKGGVVAHATETCYGLACDITDPGAVEKIFLIKQRPPSQAISALFMNIEHVKQYVEWNAQAEELSKGFPGPLTLILPIHKEAPLRLFPVLEGKPTSVGVRISSHPLAQQLVDEFGTPLSTTSANVHGQANPYSVADMVSQFGNSEYQPDIIIDSGVLPENPPSKVIDLRKGEPSVLRN